jgi:hypothetical protein
VGGEVDLPGPSAGERDQSFPGAREPEMQNDTDDTIVVVLDLSEKLLPGIKDKRLGGLDDRRPFVTDVAGRGVLQSRLLDYGRAEKLAETVEADLLGNIELEKNADGARESESCSRGFNQFRHPGKDSTVLGRMGPDSSSEARSKIL